MSEDNRVKGKKYLTEYYNAHIGRGHKRFYSMPPTDFKSVSFKDLYVDPHDSRVYVEESVDISMRESDFQRLLDVLGYFQKYGNIDQHRRDIESRVTFERSLREKHPGLKKAYNRYRVLLDMVANGKEIED
jgi:hypothetical protein